MPLPLQELEHSSELLSKNHTREMKLLQSKNASLQHALSSLDEEHNRLRRQLRVSKCVCAWWEGEGRGGEGKV